MTLPPLSAAKAALLLAAVLLLASLPVSAAVMPDYNNICVGVANDAGPKYDAFGNGSYSIRFEGYDRGLNALHISTDPAVNFGQVTTTASQSGTFYATDSGGKGYEDDILLLVAVNGTVPDDFRLHVTADGYGWTPNPISNQAPTSYDYQPVSLDETFTASDFVYGPQTWKPTGNGFDYPLFEGQDMADATNTFQLIFVDLNAGVLRPNAALENQGAVRINYSIENLDSFAAFSVYGYCQTSNNGDDMVAWTNSLLPGKAPSGYAVTAPTVTPTPTVTVTPTITATPTPTPTVAPGTGPLPAPRHIFIAPANGARYDLDGPFFGGPNGTYYVRAEGGGYNELHITNDAAVPAGQVTNSTAGSGTFWVTNNGGRGFYDDIVLLVSVQGELPDDFAVHVKSSGYTWTPNSTANQIPTSFQYVAGAVDETFTKGDFYYGPQTWKPGPGDLVTPSLPLYFGQEIADPSTAARLMFVDLGLGNLNPVKSTAWSSLVDSGGTKVEYSFTNMSSTAAFNAYGWCLAANQGANQGQGISWTNSLAATGASGYRVTAPAAPAVVQVPTGTGTPTDTNGDGLYDDLNGNGRRDFADVVLYFNQMTWIAANEPIAAFDCNGNGRIDFADVVWLFNHL